MWCPEPRQCGCRTTQRTGPKAASSRLACNGSTNDGGIKPEKHGQDILAKTVGKRAERVRSRCFLDGRQCILVEREYTGRLIELNALDRNGAVAANHETNAGIEPGGSNAWLEPRDDLIDNVLEIRGIRKFKP